jgi:hypothetical protein
MRGILRTDPALPLSRVWRNKERLECVAFFAVDLHYHTIAIATAQSYLIDVLQRGTMETQDSCVPNCRAEILTS